MFCRRPLWRSEPRDETNGRAPSPWGGIVNRFNHESQNRRLRGNFIIHAATQIFFSLFEKHRSSYFQRDASRAVDCEWRKEVAYLKAHLFHRELAESHALVAIQTDKNISGQSVHR
jgi:hypothetical protein